MEAYSITEDDEKQSALMFRKLTDELLAQLIVERDYVNEAILALKALENSPLVRMSAPVSGSGRSAGSRDASANG